MFLNKLYIGFCSEPIHDYAKMADQGRSDIDVVFTMILCGINFLIWQEIKPKFTSYLKIAFQRLSYLVSKPYELK